MSGRADEERKRGAAGGLGAQRLRVALLVLTIFGAPLVLMVTYLWMRNAVFLPPYAAQPGGTLAGRLVHADGAPAPDQEVRVLLHPRELEPTPLETLRTDADGAFSIAVPALDGCYTVIAGGGTWVSISREVSLASGEEPKLEFTLEPGCELALALARKDALPIRGGDYELVREGSTFGIPMPSEARLGAFRGASIDVGGLPPGTWKLRIELDDGTEAEYRLDLAAGRHELVLEPF
jgi:hypothetical protein